MFIRCCSLVLNAGLAVLLLGTCALCAGAQSSDIKPPWWWESYPLYVGDAGTGITPQIAKDLHGRMVEGNYEVDTGIGPLGQMYSSIEADAQYRSYKHAGFRWITYMEGFGDVILYAAAFDRKPDGSFVCQNDGPEFKGKALADLPYPFNADIPLMERQAWSWDSDQVKPGNAIRYIGPHNCVTDEDIVRPDFTHEKIGFPIPTYPDGRPATGWLKTGQYPMNAEVYDACACKDINGEMVGAIDATSKGATDGLFGRVLGKNDRLEAGQKIGDIVYGTSTQTSKDSACPFWVEYGRFIVERMLKDGGMVFRSTTSARLTASACLRYQMASGIHRKAVSKRSLRSASRPPNCRLGDRFSVDLQCPRLSQEEGDRVRHQRPGSLFRPGYDRSPVAGSPVWDAYKVFKQEAGQEELRNFYDAMKDEARKNGRPDFLISGNDIPAFSWDGSAMITWTWSAPSSVRAGTYR